MATPARRHSTFPQVKLPTDRMQINLAPDFSLPVIMVIFLANYLVVRRFFLKPISDILDWREAEISSAEKAFEDSMARFNEATAEMESKVIEAKREGSQLREKFRGEAQAFRGDLVDRTRKQAEQIVAAADESLSRDVEKARKTVVTESEGLARLAAEKIVGRKIA